MMIKPLLLWTITLLLTPFINTSYAEANPSSPNQAIALNAEEQQWLDTHPNISLGIDPSWPPYSFTSQSGRQQGLCADVVRSIEKQLNITFIPATPKSWSDTLEDARNHNIDVLSCITKTEARTHYFLFTESFLTPFIGIYTRTDNTALSNLSDLKNKTIAIENAYFLHKELATSHPEMTLLPVETTTEALRAVSYGNADAYIGNEGAANWAAEKSALNNLKITHDDSLKIAPLRLAVRGDWLILQRILNKAISAIPNDEMSAIRNKWLGASTVDSQKLMLSKEERKWLDQHPTIRFTGDPNWLPYEGFDQQENYIGIVSEYLALIEQKLDINIDIVHSPSWSESLAKVKRGEVDILSETNDSSLTSELSFTDAYLSSPVVIIMRNDVAYVENIDEIKDKKIAVISNYGYIPTITRQHPNIPFKHVASIQDGLTSVSTGENDVLLATLAQASHHISELGIHNIHIVGKTNFRTKLAFGMRQEFKPLVPLFNRALSNISPAEKQKILNAWGHEKFAAKTDYQLLAISAALFLLFLAVILYWNRKLKKEVTLRTEIEAQTKALLDNIPLQVFVTSLTGEILTVNPQVLNDFKINIEDVEKTNITELYNDINDRASILQELSEKGKVNQRIVVIKKPGGNLHSMMVSIMPISYHKEHALLTIALDMTERLAIEAELKTAKESAEKASLSKSEFLSNMSHEIRTPMNAIIGFTELLDDQVKEPKLKGFIKTIQSAGYSLLLLVNDILDLSKIEAGKMQIAKTASNPHDLLSEIASIFMLTVRNKGLDFILQVDANIPESLMLDTIRLRQILLNIVGNAVKFTEHGTIKLIATAEDADEVLSKLNLVIKVEDSGIGIPKDQLQTIFNAFEQMEQQDQVKFGGTGLGLSISSRLINLLSGTIKAESTVGVGSTFTIQLNNVDVASVQRINKAPTSDFLSHTINFEAANILVVDDIKDNRQLVREIFLNTELTFFEAKNGLEAINITQQHSIDLVLMDIKMPVMNGSEAAKRIKTIKNIPIIALTASVLNDEFERIKSSDFDDYLRKPVLRADLFKALSAFLKHNITTLANEEPVAIALSAKEISALPIVLEKLNPLAMHWQTIHQNNNISDMRTFAHDLLVIGKEHEFIPLSNYAMALIEKIDAFDINSIQAMLNAFPTLHTDLQTSQARA